MIFQNIAGPTGHASISYCQSTPSIASLRARTCIFAETGHIASLGHDELIMQYSSLQNNIILNTAIPSITCAPLQTQLADTFTIYSYAHSQCFAVLCCDYIISMG